MKRITFPGLLLAYALVLIAAMLVLAGCAVPPDLRERYAEAVAQAEAAALTSDPADDAVAEARLVALEQAVIERNASPWASLLPGGIGVAAVSVLKVLGSRRVRRHYAGALKSISRGQVLVALGDVLKAEGASHSSPESAAAADTIQPPQA